MIVGIQFQIERWEICRSVGAINLGGEFNVE